MYRFNCRKRYYVRQAKSQSGNPFYQIMEEADFRDEIVGVEVSYETAIQRKEALEQLQMGPGEISIEVRPRKKEELEQGGISIEVRPRR